MAVGKRRRVVTDVIEQANQKTDAEFVQAYLEPGAPNLRPWTTTWTHPRTGQIYSISVARPAAAGEPTLEACYALVEQTSRADYDASVQKWRPVEKRQEMREPDLRYILVRGIGSDGDVGPIKDRPVSAVNGITPKDVTSDVVAFTSLLPTYEEGQAVVYCYEIHLQPHLQSTGLGSLLLGFQSIVAHNLGPPVSRVMLTCFLSNTHALAFYHKQGFETDVTAPTARTLRGGKKAVPDYTILSKPVGKR